MTTNRSRYLARAFTTRMLRLEEALLDDAAPDAQEDAARRKELVEKVLLSETGVVDHGTAVLILSAMPRVIPGEELSERQLDEFARFIDEHLRSQA